MSRGSYNGFSEEEQSRGSQLQTTAYGNGMLVRVWRCRACKVEGHRPGDIIAHLEDYSEPIDGAIWLCYRCHTLLHLRFKHPEMWEKYKEELRKGIRYPLTKSRREIYRHVYDLFVRRSKQKNKPRKKTILDEIDEGKYLSPLSPEEMALKMSEISAKGIRYFKDRAKNQESLF